MLKRMMLANVIAVWTAVSAFAADPIQIGMVDEKTGTNFEVGAYQINGVKLAVDEINQAGGVLGRPLELTIEDNQSTNPGSIIALQKIMKAGKVAAAISSVRSTQILAMMPTILKMEIPFLVGGTDYTLTHANNPWVLRVRPHDGYSAKVIAEFGVNTLRLKRWAVVHSTEAFGIGGKSRLVEALGTSNVTPVIVQSVNNNTQDFTPVVLAIKRSGADIVATYLANPSDVGNFATALRREGVTSVLIGSPSVTAVAALRIGGNALYDSYSINDFVAEANPQAQVYAAKYRAKYRTEPDLYSSWGYDAIYLLALAIKNSNSTNPDSIRKALLEIQGYNGVEGTYNYDKNGDGVHGYNVVKNERGKIAFIKHISLQPR